MINRIIIGMVNRIIIGIVNRMVNRNSPAR